MLKFRLHKYRSMDDDADFGSGGGGGAAVVETPTIAAPEVTAPEAQPATMLDAMFPRD